MLLPVDHNKDGAMSIYNLVSEFFYELITCSAILSLNKYQNWLGKMGKSSNFTYNIPNFVAILVFLDSLRCALSRNICYYLIFGRRHIENLIRQHDIKNVLKLKVQIF